MTQPEKPDSAEPADRPGKTRTWWHPLLARLLDHELATAYSVREEVLVGRLPLRVDILLIRREGGELPATSQRDLSVLVPLLNQFTLIEFKGPTDSLEPGDVAQLVGCAFLWHSQQSERIPQADVTLIILAPTLNEPAREELQTWGWQIGEQEEGVFRITGGPLEMWVVETDVMAKRGQPILSLVSRVFLEEHERIIGELRATGHDLLLCYVLQQVARFRKMGKEFAMQHAGTEYLDEVEEELQTIMDGMPVENRLRGLSADEVLRRFTPEELADGLSKEQAARLRELLDRRESR
jgi:hypothetical protein